MTKVSLFIGVLICIGIISCRKKDPKTEPEPESQVPPVVSFNFQAKVYSQTLLIGTKKYSNSSTDSFSVTRLNYYISNIKLVREDGFIFSEPESYHLMQHELGKTTFNMTNIPQGNYTKIEFLIGVDSIRGVSGAQTGALDPANAMFWDWNQGYKFFVMEGSFSSLKQPETGEYAIHIGGFSAPYSCLQKCSINFNTAIVAKNGKQSSVFFKVQVDEVFTNPKEIGFDYYYSHISNQTFKDISDNYKDMFVVDKIEN